MKKVKQMPVSNRPREKLCEKGPKALTDKELLAVLLGSGTRTQDVFTLAGRILKVLDDTNAAPTLEQLQTIAGIGPAKATTILAALEFARRRIRPEGIKIGLPPDVMPLIQHFADRKQEHLICISLNGAYEVIAVRTVSVGLVNRTQVHPREVFADPLTDRATAIIVAHNHPAGNLTLSKDDIAITKLLEAAGKTLGIRLLDHIVFSHKGYYSFSEHDAISK